MVLEVAILRVRLGLVEQFEENFRLASPIIASIEGYQSHELRRCIEDDHKYILLVKWDSMESHTIGFRESEGYQEWKRLLHHFYDPFPVVEHFTLI
ncbi:heme-degrading monooxygenase HmoA [Paenibacillus shirakamiensis]|uniref:Heme-degrading monooxygenase HmoA n=1 Tax=Paenibacillus shirakamiensis TaxID=1265935 RepID=A0ABS4JF55_9BACL|nr:heme-degrading monooxygenase HmoA [Paenibacillus shirakamiensis]